MSHTPQIVVITGASSGIGRATALRLARRGASLVLAARRGEALAEVADECIALGGDAVAVVTDVADWESVEQLADVAERRFGHIDGWVNCAAVSVFAPFLEMPLKDFRRVIDVDLMGYVHGCRAALALMTRTGHGSIVNVSSIVGEVPQPYTAPYGMAKAAVRALGVSLRSELALGRQKHIHVSTVLPPTIDTPFFQHSANYTGRKVVAMPPVYPADVVAKAIVKTLDSPRHEVVVGRLGKSLVKQHRVTPAPVEAQMAAQVETSQLSRHEKAGPTTGSIFTPSTVELASVSGGWGGKRRLARRKALGAVLIGAATVALATRTRKS